jgi:hypothetical protein
MRAVECGGSHISDTIATKRWFSILCESSTSRGWSPVHGMRSRRPQDQRIIVSLLSQTVVYIYSINIFMIDAVQTFSQGRLSPPDSPRTGGLPSPLSPRGWYEGAASPYFAEARCVSRPAPNVVSAIFCGLTAKNEVGLLGRTFFPGQSQTCSLQCHVF